MKVAVLGATRGMGRAMARQFAERNDDVFLLGLDAEDNGKSARDLEIRAGRPVASVGTALCDLLQPASFGPALSAAENKLGGLDAVVVTAGLFAPQAKLESDPAFTEKLLTANFTNTILFCEEARKRLLARGGGTLCVFSSVAGERGRKPVGLYGASKAGLSRYLEALDHKHRADGLRTITVKPGFVKTDMTRGLPTPPFAGEPDGVARSVVKAIDRGTPVVYALGIWSLIMMVIRLLPRFVMRKINF
jgi:NAD(P)-dependent dehydrogenase (short-subunit alcohol dehydrogenase family)